MPKWLVFFINVEQKQEGADFGKGYTLKELLLLWKNRFCFEIIAFPLTDLLGCCFLSFSVARVSLRAPPSPQTQVKVEGAFPGSWLVDVIGGGVCFLRVFANLSFGPHRPCSASLPHLYLMLTMFRTSSASTRRDRTWTLLMLLLKQTKTFIGRYQCLHL